MIDWIHTYTFTSRMNCCTFFPSVVSISLIPFSPSVLSLAWADKTLSVTHRKTFRNEHSRSFVFETSFHNRVSGNLLQRLHNSESGTLIGTFQSKHWKPCYIVTEQLFQKPLYFETSFWNNLSWIEGWNPIVFPYSKSWWELNVEAYLD